MKSSKGEGTVAAAEQLGSMSLGETAVERKDDDTEPNAENGTTLTKSCSACEKKSDTLKKCTACKCIWYCDKHCQKRHRSEHRHECKRIKKELEKRGGELEVGMELDVGPLGKLPPREECQICMRVLPNYESLHAYANCCGKTICGGCMLQHQKKTEEMNARKNAERARREQPPVPRTCAFCREPIPESDEELLAGARKRAERKDPHAMYIIAMGYCMGILGYQLMRRSALTSFANPPVLAVNMLSFNSEPITTRARWVLNRTRKKRVSIGRKLQTAVTCALGMI